MRNIRKRIAGVASRYVRAPSRSMRGMACTRTEASRHEQRILGNHASDIRGLHKKFDGAHLSTACTAVSGCERVLQGYAVNTSFTFGQRRWSKLAVALIAVWGLSACGTASNEEGQVGVHYPSTVELDPVKDLFSLDLANGASQASYGLHLPEEAPQEKKQASDIDNTAAVLEFGRASWYGNRFHGRLTASGERYDMNAMTAAHRTLPFDTMVCVRGLLRNREVLVRINDRGPYAGNRVIDLSRAAAEKLDMLQQGLKDVVLWIPEKDGPQCGDGTAAIEPESPTKGGALSAKPSR